MGVYKTLKTIRHNPFVYFSDSAIDFEKKPCIVKMLMLFPDSEGIGHARS